MLWTQSYNGAHKIWITILSHTRTYTHTTSNNVCGFFRFILELHDYSNWNKFEALLPISFNCFYFFNVLKKTTVKIRKNENVKTAIIGDFGISGQTENLKTESLRSNFISTGNMWHSILVFNPTVPTVFKMVERTLKFLITCAARILVFSWPFYGQ